MTPRIKDKVVAPVMIFVITLVVLSLIKYLS